MSELSFKICDRCGKPVKNDNIAWLIMPYKTGNDERYPFNRMTMDLCDDCVSSLTDWLLNNDNERKHEFKNKLIELVDQGVFDRRQILTAGEIKNLLKYDPLNEYIPTIHESMFEKENSHD